MDEIQFKLLPIFLLAVILGATMAGCDCPTECMKMFGQLESCKHEWDACRYELETCQTIMHAQGFETPQ